ncbi:uncharacterized protein LOC119080763 isoform X2 [Bradysia coprophila]|nr:uncharacterized protein LOC119080763 isoform X2 [Bradysia coprophila]
MTSVTFIVRRRNSHGFAPIEARRPSLSSFSQDISYHWISGMVIVRQSHNFIDSCQSWINDQRYEYEIDVEYKPATSHECFHKYGSMHRRSTRNSQQAAVTNAPNIPMTKHITTIAAAPTPILQRLRQLFSNMKGQRKFHPNLTYQIRSTTSMQQLSLNYISLGGHRSWVTKLADLEDAKLHHPRNLSRGECYCQLQCADGTSLFITDDTSNINQRHAEFTTHKGFIRKFLLNGANANNNSSNKSSITQPAIHNSYFVSNHSRRIPSVK